MPSRTPGTRLRAVPRQAVRRIQVVESVRPTPGPPGIPGVRCGCAAPGRSVAAAAIRSAAGPAACRAGDGAPTGCRSGSERVHRRSRCAPAASRAREPVPGQGARCSAYRRGRQHSYVARTPSSDCAGKTSTSGHGSPTAIHGRQEVRFRWRTELRFRPRGWGCSRFLRSPKRDRQWA